MARFVPISKEEFSNALKFIGATLSIHESFLYDVYSFTIEGIDTLAEEHVFGDMQGINHLEIIAYCVGEYSYFISGMNDDDIVNLQKDENFLVMVSSIVADKYLSLSQFSYNEGSLVSRFAPQVSTLNVYVNFMQNVTKSFNKKDPRISLLVDLFMKSISICKCTLDLLVKGFETEAFSCWRTLHECECVLIALYNNQAEAMPTYLKHMQYSLAFKDTMCDKDKQTEIFNSMKDEMREFGLKSKDIKKYIEYGWLYSIKSNKEDETFKLNFRDGLEKSAGLSAYAKRYEMSSEIIHGTPLLVYSNRQYFYFLALLSTYESFFRLEKIFLSTFSLHVSEEQLKGYQQMRSVYYSHLVAIHQKEMNKFKSWQKSNKK